MLETLILIVFVSISSITVGLPLILYFNKSPIVVINEQKLILSFFTGLSLVSLYSAWITLFLPLHFLTLSPLVAFGFIILFFKRKVFQWESSISYRKHKFELAFFVIACLVFIQLGSLEPYMADTKTYHLQIVRWSQQYKAVPGLANLGPRFCFPSNWFHLISSFSFSTTQGNLQYLNTALSIWFTFFLLLKIIENNKKITFKEHKLFASFYLFLFLFMSLGWNLLRGNCRSLGNDFIVTILTLYILLDLVERLVLKNKEEADLRLLLLLAISIPFYKLSGSFIIILLLVFFIQTKQPLKLYSYTAVLWCLFAVPFLTKNYIQTGYPLYPYNFLDFFSPDWKLPGKMMERFMAFNYLSNKYIYQGIPDGAWQYLPFNWLDSWFYKMALYDQALIILFFISLAFFSIKNNRQDLLFKKIVVYLLCTIPILTAWFLLSPDPRFVYAYLLFPTFFLFAVTGLPLLSNFVLHKCYSLVMTSIFFFFIFKAVRFEGPIFKAQSASKPAHSKLIIDNNQFNIPIHQPRSTSTYCSDIIIPCIYQFNPYLEMRGDQFDEGFKMKKDIDSTFINSYAF